MKMKLLIIILLSGLAFSACDDWLDVTSSTEIKGDDLLSEESGMKDALIGVYLAMGDQYTYGKYSSWYFPDLLVYPYKEYSEFNNIQNHVYTSTKVMPLIENMWLYNYKTIANINNLLKNMESNKSALNRINYALMKGELLGLRAYVHFDLMRMFGLGNWANDGSVDNKQTIPYVTAYSKDETQQQTYDETFKMLISDIDSAVRYLGEDPIRELNDDSYYKEVNTDGFYNNRDKRMNYFAVKALAARVYMWRGNAECRTKAFALANEVIEKAPFKWIDQLVINNPVPGQQDLTFSTEQLFALDVMGLGDLFLDYYNTDENATSFKMLGTDVEQYIFETSYYEYVTGRGWWYDETNPTGGPDGDGWFYEDDYEINEVLPGASDVRFARLLTVTGGGYYTSIKHRQIDKYLNNYRNRIPMLRISEMYYILSECYAMDGNKEKALEMLDVVRENRGITEALSGDTDPCAELTKEYMREFINEGQFLYYLKRLGITDPLDGKIDGYEFKTSDFLVPYPDTEVEIGKRVQDK